jgi:hypothetical protein
MSIVRARPMAALAALIAAATVLASCNKGDTSSGAVSKDDPLAGLESAALADNEKSLDPCTYLTGSEAESFVGKLKTPPYRANDDASGDVAGGKCMYLGADGRQLTVSPTPGTGAGKILQDVPNMVGNALGKAGMGNMESTTHRVMADIKGPWDRATWIPGGTLFVTKGDMEAGIDVSGSSGQQKEAVAVANLVVSRFGHPLNYDGAKAVALLPKPKEHPASACDLVPKSDVEAAIGPLTGAPIADPDGTKCTYQVASDKGPRTYSIEIVWQGGRKNYNMLVHGMSTLGSVMGGNIPMGGLDAMPKDSTTRNMIGGLMKMAGGGGNAAPGAATQVGFKTDTVLKGPWDNASLQHGTQLFAVKNDIMVGMDLQSADYEKAKALLVAVCSKL